MNDDNNSDYYYGSQAFSSFSMNDDSGDDDLSFSDDHSTANSSSNYSTINSQTRTSSTKNQSANSPSLNDKRRSRNQNEKKRRDQFNFLIQGLGLLLNHPRKIDKATVLSETLYFFRNYNDKPLYNKEIEFKYKPFFLENDEFMRFMIEFQNAFCLVFDLNGQIKYVSDDVMILLGHNPKNLQSCSLFEFVDEKSAKQIKYILRQKYSPLDSIGFECKFKKGNLESTLFEAIKVNGFFKPDSGGHFNCIAKLNSFMRISELYPRDNNKREFVTEFSIDFKYTSIDSKATAIIGFNQIELIGTCGYDYMHHDDLEKIIDCHKKLIQNGAVPTITYRMRTKGSQWLWLQSRFQMLTHQFSMKPYAILSYNQVVTLNEMSESRDMFDNSAHSTFFSSSADSVPCLPSSSNAMNEMESTSKNNKSESIIKSELSANESFDQHKKSLDGSEVAPSDSKSSQSEISANSSSSNGQNNDRKIDESLESIFIRSYTDLKYRSYVLSQFKMKKQKIENTLRKNQEELKILEETMENIGDEKKLASWVLEFQKKELTNKQQLHHQQQQQQQKEDKMHITNSNNSNSQQSSSYSSQNRTHYLDNSSSTMSSLSAQLNSFASPSIPQSQTNNTNANQNNNQPQILIMSEYASFQNNASKLLSTAKNSESTQSLERILKTELNENFGMGTDNSQSMSFMDDVKAGSMPNEESNIVGDLISLQNMLPQNTLNKSNQKSSLNNNNNSNNFNNNNNNSNSNFEIEDINSEIIDKLFNSYSFE